MKQHGVNGVFYGGTWLELEQCAEKFNFSSCSDCETCPRSRSRDSAAKEDGSYDVIIVGAGCIGAAIARELAKYKLSVLVLEAADDVTQGATKGNSGIVHAGYDDTPGSVRAKFCWKGNQMFPQLDRELRFGYQKNGSLVLATSEEEKKHLYELLERGKKNGVERLEILNREQVLKLEPYVSKEVVAGLYSPDAGNLIPYEFAIALMENAVDNGVELRTRRQVTAISSASGMFSVTARHWEPESFVQHAVGSEATRSESAGVAALWKGFAIGMFVLGLQRFGGFGLAAATAIAVAVALVLVVAWSLVFGKSQKVSSSGSIPPSVGTGGQIIPFENMIDGGSGSAAVMNGKTVDLETYTARYVINCAGSGSDKIAKMIGDTSFKIKPRLGDYLLLNRNQGKYAHCTLFPCPGPLGKGILVQQTLWGNLILGPTARDLHVPSHMNESREDVQRFILAKCRKLVDAFDPKEVIHSFSGIRAKSDRNDWIIERSGVEPNFINVAGIDSPGLAGCPAITLEVVRLLSQTEKLQQKRNFNPNRSAIIVPKAGFKGLKMSKFEERHKNSDDPKANVVCKCEKVTEAEVVEALHRSLPVDSTQAIRKRTRAGMGHCQGDAENYNCECRVAEIIARELKTPVEQVGRRPWPATSTLKQRWLTPEQKQELVELSK